MPQHKRPLLLPPFSGQELNGKNNQAKQEDKQADPVNAMHITNPFILWPVGIFFAEIEVFRYLFPDTHNAICLQFI